MTYRHEKRENAVHSPQYIRFSYYNYSTEKSNPNGATWKYLLFKPLL